MNTFQVGEHTYQARPLSALQQLDIATRVGISLSGMADVKRADPAADQRRMCQALAAHFGMAAPEAVAHVTYVCLSVVSRQSGPGWAAIMGPAPGQMMFQDIGLQEILAIVWAVLEANRLPDFFDVPPSTSAKGIAEGSS